MTPAALLRLPPTKALTAAGAALVPVVGVGVVVTVLGGPVGAVWFVLGVATALPVASHDVPWTDRALCAGLAWAASVLGLAAGGPVTAALVVAAVSLLQAPLGRRTPGAGAMLPVLAAVAASTGLPDHRWTTGLAVTAGAVTIVVTAGLLGLRRPAVDVPLDVVWRHAVALAVIASLTLGVVMHAGVTHGYWLVLTLSLVLRPAADETRALARDRIAGTLAGLVVGVAAVALLPLAVALAMAAACVLLTAAWGMAGDSRRATAYAAPLLVLVGSSGLAGTGVGLAVERMLATVAGVLLAAVAAWCLDVLDRRAARP